MAITSPLDSSFGGPNDALINDGSDLPLPEPVPSSEFDREAEDNAARPLLARANLLRMRGQWDEAIAVCTDALRRAPHSASAHSLLGDVYEAQNKTDEAVQWFGMACDLDPTNQADRAKLDRVLVIQNAKLLAEQKAAGITAPPPVHKPATEKTLEWLDRILPPGKSESVARLIFGLSGVIALMILVAAGFLWQTGRNQNALPVVESLPGNPNSGNGGLPPLTSSAPVVVTPPAAASQIPSRPAAVVAPTAPTPLPATRPLTDQTPPQIAGTTPAKGIPPSSSAFSPDAAPVAARFAGLLAANAQAAPTLRLQGAQIDAAQNRVRLDVSAQIVPGETVLQTRERVLRAAVLAVRAAGEANVSATQATVRVHLMSGNVPSANAFVGTIPLSLARDMDVWGAAPADLLSRFTSLQWSPALMGVTSTLPAATTAAATFAVTSSGPASSSAAASRP